MRPLLAAVLLGAALVSGCDVERPPVAYGDANSIIAVVPDEFWSAVKDTVEEALQPTVFTVRREKTFRLTQVSPSSKDWIKLRRFRQILVIGRPGETYVKEVLDHVDGPVPEPPAIVEAHDVWADQQVVNAVLLPEEGNVTALQEMLPELHDLIDGRFRQYVRQRMFMSGADEALADSVMRTRGWSLTLPTVYKHDREDSVWVFTNSIVDPKELYRAILVDRRPGTGPLTEAAVLAWRSRLVAAHFPRPQVMDTAAVEVDSTATEEGRPVLEVHGPWGSPAGMTPAGGPFVTWIVACPGQGRTYLLDASLYAPAYEKYEYMIQLRTILSTFRCRGS